MQEVPGKLSYLKLYSYAQPFDWLLITLGLIGAVVDGITFPAFTLIFASLVNTFGTAQPGQDITDDINRIAIDFLYLAAAAGISSYFEIAMFKLAGAFPRLLLLHKCTACTAGTAGTVPWICSRSTHN